jgi:hypothetical protein
LEPQRHLRLDLRRAGGESSHQFLDNGEHVAARHETLREFGGAEALLGIDRAQGGPQLRYDRELLLIIEALRPGDKVDQISQV